MHVQQGNQAIRGGAYPAFVSGVVQHVQSVCTMYTTFWLLLKSNLVHYKSRPRGACICKCFLHLVLHLLLVQDMIVT